MEPPSISATAETSFLYPDCYPEFGVLRRFVAFQFIWYIESIMNVGKFHDLVPQLQELVKRAVKIKRSAYAPYSHFQVGAAVLCDNGEIIVGCNVENASYGLSMCAERTAVINAVTLGYRQFKALAVSCDIADKFVGPCGACRQVCAEFGTEWDVYLVMPETLDWKMIKVKDLLPLGFGPNNLK